MGITRGQFDNILKGIFEAGNVIKLYSQLPDEATETGGKTFGQSYTIQSGDFECGSGTAMSKKNMMMYLAEEASDQGTAYGFGVFKASTLLYFGSFTPAMPVTYNSVPTIKKYDATKGEGIMITMTSTDVSV